MPDKDYYQLLCVSRQATEYEINNAYRRLALKYHPESQDGSENHFRDIAEAYTVLSCPVKRSKFDMYGERGLKDGVMEDSNYKGYQYVEDPMVLFEFFFGQTSPVALMLAEYNGKFNLAPRTLQNENSAKATNLELRCTLDELYSGAIKTQKVERQRFNADMKSFTDTKTLTLQIGAGWKPGTKLVFRGEGNQIHPTAPAAADVIFTVTESPHSKFERITDSYDILYIHKCSLLESLTGHVINLQLLDESTLNLHVPETVSPGYEKRILEHGLQKPDGSYGDLLVRWDIQFPSLTSSQKAALKDVLAN